MKPYGDRNPYCYEGASRPSESEKVESGLVSSGTIADLGGKKSVVISCNCTTSETYPSVYSPHCLIVR